MVILLLTIKNGCNTRERERERERFKSTEKKCKKQPPKLNDIKTNFSFDDTRIFVFYFFSVHCCHGIFYFYTTMYFLKNHTNNTKLS